MMYYEDLALHDSKISEQTHEVTAGEIKAFAGQWDPMPFHLDEEVAKASPMGGLFASSLHTVAIGTRLGHSMIEEGIAMIAGLGWDELRFPKPVMVGDVLRCKSEIVDKRVSNSKPNRGIVVTQMTVTNQNEDVVATYKFTNMVFRRPE